MLARWCPISAAAGANACGLLPMDAEDGIAERVLLEGRSCLRVVNPFGAPFGYFRFWSDLGRLRSSVLVSVEVLCDADTELWIEYDSRDERVLADPAAPGAFKSTTRCALRRTACWETFRFLLPDANFMRRVNGADFRIVMARETGVSMHIGAVKVGAATPRPRPRRRVEAGIPARRGGGGIAFDAHASPQVSIVIPVFNRIEYTIECLAHIAAGTDGSFEVVIVDDGSAPACVDVLAGVRGARLVRQPRNLGFAKACNRGAAEARGRFLVFLNNDTAPQPGWLSQLVACQQRHPGAGVLGSKLLFPLSGEIQHAGVGFAERGLPYHLYQFRAAGDPDANVEREVPAVTGACLFTPADTFRELGGLDEGFVNGYEDIDYCLRVRERGRRVVYCPSSTLLHYESATEGRLDPDRESRNRGRFLSMWSDAVAALRSDPRWR